ncbi:MAG: hypothetical protein EBX52_08045 [Proteobacteria bacterium]|nr:hypothetical protein [Pseudomonadota bacterium]
MNRKSIFSALFALTLIATACSKNSPVRTSGLTNKPANSPGVQTARKDLPPADQRDRQPDQPSQADFNPICANLPSLAGTWTSKNPEKGTTLTGIVSENTDDSREGKATYTSEETKRDQLGAELLKYHADISYDRTTCTLRKIPSRTEGFISEINRRILSVKQLEDGSLEVKTRLCANSICTQLKDETKTFKICPNTSTDASVPNKEIPKKDSIDAEAYAPLEEALSDDGTASENDPANLADKPEEDLE